MICSTGFDCLVSKAILDNAVLDVNLPFGSSISKSFGHLYGVKFIGVKCDNTTNGWNVASFEPSADISAWGRLSKLS